MTCLAGFVPFASANASWHRRDEDATSVCLPRQRLALVPTAVDARSARRTARVRPVARARAGAARGGDRGSARAQGGKRGKPIQSPPPRSKSGDARTRKNAKPPPPDPGAGVRPAGARARASVKAVATGTPFADLRGGPLLSPAARRDPEKAREERRALWERLGANSRAGTGFAHLLETAAPPSPGGADAESSERSETAKRRGSGRGASGTRQRGSSRATLRLGFTAHREKYAKALRLELEEEMARAEERLEAWPKERLGKEGYALFGLRGLHDGTLQRDAVVRVLVPRGGALAPPPAAVAGAANEGEGLDAKKTKTREREFPKRAFALGAELPFHRFGQGDMVSLVEGDEHDPSGKASVTGVVVERAMHFLKIAVDEEDEALVLGAGKLRLDLSANTVSHDRALAALAAFSECGGMPGYDAEPSTGARRSTSAYAPLQRAAIGIPDGDPKTVRDARASVAALAAAPPPWAGKDASGAVRRAVNGTRAATLNDSQRTAVRRALTRTLSVWQGPPGTGKTRALTAFVEAAVFFALEERASSRQKTKNKTGTKTTNASAGPIALACAASNVAVDNIVAGLISSDTRVGAERRPLRVVRLGSPAKVQATLEASTLGAQAALTPLGRKAAAMRAEARGDYTSRGAATRRLAFQLETQAAHAVLRAADVVCATCVGAGDDLLEGFTFRVACVDEAAQCPEPAALIPVSKALTCVLVGDAAQLPPTVTSMDALHAGLGVSLFERMERLGVVPDLLDRQYRMHPALAEFPSARFYGGRVASDPAPADRPPPPGAPWARRDAGVDARPRSNSNAWSPYPVLFVEVDGGRETREKDGLSVVNPAEARAAVAAAAALLEASANGDASNRIANLASDIGIIAPYAAQVRRVRELWTERSELLSKARPSRDASAPSSSDPLGGLEVHSVDGFQGREKEVIVLCTTRANDGGNLGFVRDDRRMNVAMTRARRGLIVLGNRATLAADPTWREWLAWIDARGLATRSSDFFDVVDAGVDVHERR